MMRLADRVALVTGASRGIGRGCAVELAREGADVVVNYRSHPDEAEEVAREIRGMGRRAMAYGADVGDRTAVDGMVATALAEFGRIDILVNNAAYSIRKPFVEYTEAEFAEVLQVAMWSVFHCSQAVARHMIARGGGGKILVISSIHAFIPFPNSSPYNTAKAGINHMAFTLAGELAPHRINVNVIEPGWTDTPGERRYFTEEQLRTAGQQLPWGRLGRSEEIGKAAAFLCSDDADYITGASLRVDGGVWLKRG
jgi:glucose 1-dehydrogenase